MNGVKAMYQLNKQVEKNIIPTETAETLFANPMTQVQSALTKVLRDNNILSADAQEEQKKVEKIVGSMVKVQNHLVKPSKMFQIKAVLEAMLVEIKSAMGGILNEEIDRAINLFSSNFVEI